LPPPAENDEVVHDHIDQNEALERLSRAALALEDMFVTEGLLDVSGGNVEVDIVKANGSSKTLSFPPCRLDKVGDDGDIQPIKTMQHLLSVSELSAFVHGSKTKKDLTVRKALHISADKIKSIRGIDMDAILKNVHTLLLPDEPGIRAELLKLNIYRKE